MKTLLIYEQVPEKTDMYLIPNEVLDSKGYWDLMKQAHNRFINSDEENEGMKFLNAALCSEDHINDDTYFDDGYTSERVGSSLIRVKTHEPTPKEWRCVLAKYKVDISIALQNEHITRVVLSGFMM